MFHIYRHSSITLSESPGVKTGTRGKVARLIAEMRGEPVLGLVKKFGDPDASRSLVVSTNRLFNVVARPSLSYRLIVNLEQVNSIRGLSHFLAEVNRQLPLNGRLVCCLETSSLRKRRIYQTYPGLTGKLYHLFDYLLFRVMPAMKWTRWINRLLTARFHHVISYYEMLGRLNYCGFETEHDEEVDGRHYVVARKVSSSPQHPVENYGMIVGLNRIGKGGKTIKVYKFRTMVPFSEYVQDYIYRQNRLQSGGKFMNDKRITREGRYLRKLWIDEIPMVINWFKGEVKLVGVRPLSSQYLGLYDIDVIHRRTAVLPGLIPPYYADLPSTLDEIQASEMRYLERWEKAPLRTDFLYLFRAMWNIFFRGARSR
ncbi:MAG: sugar transferase [Marinilabilia sp.]